MPFTPGTNDNGPETWRIHADQLPADAGVEALPVKRPARRTAAVFRALSQRLGVTLPESQPGRAPDNARAVAALFSAPLLDTLRPALRYSNNLVSELIGRAVSRRLAGKPLDGEASAEAVTGWLKGRLPDIDWQGLRLDNHSGLSAESRVTPRQMQAVVTAAMRMRFGGWHFAAILPAGGWDGALGGRFTGPASAGRVWAKSGTMHYAKGLCGLVFSAAGKRLGFALYITDFERRAAHERDPARLSPLKQEAARAWIERAETVMEDVVGAWIAAH